MKQMLILSHLTAISMRFFAILSLTCCACTFQLNEEAFTRVDPASPRPFDVAVFHPGETIYIHRPTSIVFDFDPDGKDIIRTSVFLGSQEIYSTENDLEGFYFDPSNYPDGTHTLTIEYYQKSFSGSLADKLNAEVFTYSDSCKVVVDNVPVPKMIISQFEVVNKTLVIHWPAYADTLFSSYTIVYGDGSHEHEITDPSITSLEVPQFLGGSIIFKLTIRAKGEVVSNIINYSDDLDLHIEPTNFDSLRIRFNGSPYQLTDLILRFERQEYDNVPISWLDIPVDENEVDTLIYFPVSFPYNYDIHSTFGGQPGIGGTNAKKITSTLNYFNGSLVYMKPEGGLAGITYDYFRTGFDLITAGNISSGTVEKSEAGSFGLSHDGKQLFRVNMLSTTSMSVEKFDPITALQIGTTKVVSIPPKPNQTIYSVSTSNDEYVFVNYGGYNFHVLYHWPTNTITYQGTVSMIGIRPAWVANGGTQFFELDRYVDLTGVGALEMLPTKAGSKAINLPHRNQYVYFDAVTSHLRLINFNDGNEQNSILITGTVQKLCANAYNDLAVIIRKPNNTYWVEVYDLDSGTLLGHKRINSSLYTSTSTFDFNFQLSENWFRIGHFTDKQYMMKFNFPL